MALHELEDHMRLEKLEKGSVMLSVHGVSFSYGAKPILDKTSFSLNAGDKVALVGPNGAGKTTLINMIRGQIEPEEGKITLPKRVRIGYMPQTIGNADVPANITIGQFMLSARGLDQLEQEIVTLTAKMKTNSTPKILEKFADVQERYQMLDGYVSQAEIGRLLAGVGLASFDEETPMQNLSGGQKSRLLLTRVLFSKPNLLLLDEPGNHLDDEVMHWLKGYLKDFQGAMLVVSHDKRFLDDFSNRVLRINEFTHKLESYTGNFSQCLEEIENRRQRQAKERKIQERELARLWKTVNMWRRRSKNAPVAKRAERKARVLQENLVERPKRARLPSFYFAPETRSFEHVVRATDLRKSYDGENFVVDGVSFNIFRGERMAILGPNGAGKTTLIRIIVGDLAPDEGNIKLGGRVSLGYYAQEHEGLNNGNMVLQEVNNLRPGLSEQQIRSVLGRLLLTGDIAEREVKTLSVGEKAKLALSKFLLRGDNTLVLDEPTNHLDIPSKEALGRVLAEYEGTVIISSHDDDLLDLLDLDKILMMPDGKIVQRTSQL